jgi:PTS system nitrogen regulatory IIA component
MTQVSDNQQFNFEIYMDDPLYTVQEAAEYCKVSKSTIQKWRREGLLPCVRVFSDIRFRRSDLNKFINENLSWGWVKGNTK